jgi:putative ABC transport system permease protein
MLKNYLKIAFRSLWRNKVHSSINIIGLALGIACCVLIVLFVKDEWTFDVFHSKVDRIYRAYVQEDYGENEKFFNTVTPFPLGPVLKENFPEIEHEVRINRFVSLTQIEGEQFTDQITIVGKNFFDVFDFDLYGDQSKAFADQNKVVLTREMATKYFGDADAIGKSFSIQLNEQFENFIVTGVVERVPTNSSIQFDILISDLNYSRLYGERVLTSGWFNVTPETYILIKEGADATALERKFPALFKTLLGEDYAVSNYTVGLQPLSDIHLNPAFPVGIAPVSNPKYGYILAAIALLILLVACINFITLSVGRSLKRAKEVGIRKVVGAHRIQVATQFLSEAVLVTMISLALGFLLAVVSLPVFNELAGKSLVMEFNGFMVAVSMLLVVIIGIISGSYPALLLSGFKPISILKGIQTGADKQRLRKVLVGIQLVLAIFLITSTLIMQEQLSYLQNKDLGFNKEHVMVVPLNVPANGRLFQRIDAGFIKSERFKSELESVPDVAQVCVASHDMATGAWTNIGYTDDADTYRTFFANIVDADYVPVMNMTLASGRNFSKDNLADKRRSIIVNEAFAREYGWDATSAVGKRVPGKNFPDHEIIGVVTDFHYAPLYTRVEPLVLAMSGEVFAGGIENIGIQSSPIPKLLIRLQVGNMANTISLIERSWERLTGGEEFQFSFMDEALATQYRNDQNLGKIVRIATLLAILIGSLGLYGLASLAMQARIKEISIRKVMGATERSILFLLSKEYMVMIVISLILSVPITLYFMSEWLSGFQYSISITPTTFLLAGIVSLMIALVAIGYQTLRASWTQPAETLKYE